MQQELNPYSELKAATNVSVFDMDAIPKKKTLIMEQQSTREGSLGSCPQGRLRCGQKNGRGDN